MHDVEKRPTDDQQGHYDNVCLHDGGRHGRGKFGERIAHEHGRIRLMLVWKESPTGRVFDLSLQ
jgi:hypothetical protein